MTSNGQRNGAPINTGHIAGDFIVDGSAVSGNTGNNQKIIQKSVSINTLHITGYGSSVNVNCNRGNCVGANIDHRGVSSVPSNTGSTNGNYRPRGPEQKKY